MIYKNQKEFFNLNSKIQKKQILSDENVFMKYIFDDLRNTLKKAFCGCNSVFDYGCGTGDISVILRRIYPQLKITSYDIAAEAIKVAKLKNKSHNIRFVDSIEDSRGLYDGLMIINVLHHAGDYQNALRQAVKILKPGGKIVVWDLTSNNPFIKIGRAAFIFLPKSLKKQFSDDLVVDGSIPDKNPVDPDKVINMLIKEGFLINETRYKSLFTFLLSWVDRYLNLSRFRFFVNISMKLINWENKLLELSWLQKYSEIFVIIATKTA